MHLACMCVLLPRPLLCSLSSLSTAPQTEMPVVPASMVMPVVPATIVREDDPTEKLMKLKGLLNTGALSQYEYEKKKVELMEKI